MPEAVDPIERAFLGVERSASGQRWVSRLDQAGLNRALAMSQHHGMPELIARVLAGRGVAVDTHVLGEPSVRRTRYFRDIVARAKGRHSLLAYLTWRGQPRAMLMLGRRGLGFSRDEVAHIEQLLPELCAARATYGWPFAEQALPAAPPSRWFGAFAPGHRLLESLATGTGQLRVRDRDGFREMVAEARTGDLIWTRANLSRPSQSGWPYIELFHVAAAVASERRRALFIGLGGAVAVRQFARSYPGIELDVVEHEPSVLELARRWFDVDSIPGAQFHVADGAELVRRAPAGHYDVIIVDAYTAHFAHAFGQRPFFAAARRALSEGGALGLNLIGSLDGTGELPALLAAARSELGVPRIIPVLDAERSFDPSASRNLVLVWPNPRG